MEYLNLVYTTEGRLNRLRFLKYQVLFTLFSAAVAFVLGFIGGFISGDPESALVTVPTGIWSFITGIGGIMITIRRLHDLDKSGWFILLALIPIVNIGFAIYVWFFKGTDGYNRFGADPLTY